jgi:hypothetical protein
MLQRRRVGESRLRVPHATGADWAHLGFEGLPITRVIAALPSRGVARWQAATVESLGEVCCALSYDAPCLGLPHQRRKFEAGGRRYDASDQKKETAPPCIIAPPHVHSMVV